MEACPGDFGSSFSQKRPFTSWLFMMSNWSCASDFMISLGFHLHTILTLRKIPDLRFKRLMASYLQNTTDQGKVTQLTTRNLDVCCGSVSPVKHCMVLQDRLVAGKLFPDEIGFIGTRIDGRHLKIFCRRVFTNLYFIIIPCKRKQKYTNRT